MPTFTKLGVVVMACLAMPAAAGPRTLAVASGDCRDPELLNVTTAISDAISNRLGAEAVDPSQVLERFRPRPTSNLDDVKRQVEAAQTQFYSSQYDKALEGAQAAQEELERMPPSSKPWKLTAQARVLEGLVLKAQNKKVEATEAFRRVLRIEPDFKLDPDYYPPATIKDFEQVRKEAQKVKRLPVSITSAPAGAEVFVDGQSLGKTPFKGNLLPGDYRIVLATAEQTSFVYDLRVQKALELQVDLGFESALRSSLPLCMTDPAQGFERALKLAARVGAEQAVVLRIDSRSGEPGWATAVLLDVSKGARIREGGMKAANARRGDSLSELANFVLTGKANPPVVPFTGNGPPPMVAADASEPPVAARTDDASSPAPVTLSQRSGRGNGPRIAGFVVAGAGLAAGLAGVGLYLGGAGDRQTLANLVDEDGNLSNTDERSREAVATASSNIARTNTTAVVLGAVGGLLLITGLIVALALPPTSDEGPQVSFFFSPAPGAALAGLTGRF